MNSRSESTAVRIDFHNADTDGYVRLNAVGTTEDFARLKVRLVDGLQLRATDGEIVVVGIVRTPGAEGVWRLQVDWQEIFSLHAKLE